MRDELRELLVNGVPMVNGGVWEPSAAGPDLPKPHLVIREGPQNKGEPYADFTTVYEVWPFVKRTTFKQVDALSKEVIAVLDKKRFDVNGIPHYIKYDGAVSEDMVDEEWDALTRGLRFQIYSLAWLVHVPIDPDPVEAMQEWSKSRFSELQTDPSSWSPSDNTPALYWRVDSITESEPMNWGTWLTMQLNGHVIAPDKTVRRRWVDKVVRRLAGDADTRMSDNSKMRFIRVSADDGYDPFRDGQISLTVKFGVLRKKEPVPLLKHAYFDSERGGEAHVD